MLFISTITLSQFNSETKTLYEIYQVKSYSLSEVKNKHTSDWPKPLKTNLTIILQIDSTFNEYASYTDDDVKRTLKVYSDNYHEYYLNDLVNYTSDIKGNILIEFKCVDDKENDCVVKIIYYNKKSYVVIEYKDLIIKYDLTKDITLSKNYD